MNEINFLPAKYARMRAKRRRGVRQTALVGILTLALAGWWLEQQRQTSIERNKVDTAEAEVAAARTQMQELMKLREEHKHLIHELNIQRELAQPVNHTQVIATLGSLLPSSVTLTQLTMDTKRPPPKAVKKDDSKSTNSSETKKVAKRDDRIKIDLEAVAPNDLTVANLVGTLSSHPLFTNVMMRYSRADEFQGVSGRRFRLEMTVGLDRQYEPTSQRQTQTPGGVIHES